MKKYTDKERLNDIIKNIKIIDKIHNLSDSVYAVRASELKGWDGPNVVAYSKAVTSILQAIDAAIRGDKK